MMLPRARPKWRGITRRLESEAERRHQQAIQAAEGAASLAKQLRLAEDEAKRNRQAMVTACVLLEKGHKEAALAHLQANL